MLGHNPSLSIIIKNYYTAGYLFIDMSQLIAQFLVTFVMVISYLTKVNERVIKSFSLLLSNTLIYSK